MSRLATLVARRRGATSATTLTHYGTATLPTSTPSFYTPTNTFGTGRTFSPANAAELNTLFTTGALGGFTLAVNDTVVLTDGVTYTNSTYPTVTLPVVTGADETNPVWIVTSNTARLPTPGRGIVPSTVAACRLSSPHFRQINNNVAALTMQPNAHGWRRVGLTLDAGTCTSSYGLDVAGPVMDTLREVWSSSVSYKVGEQVSFGGSAYLPLYTCLLDHSNKNPEDNATYWELVNARGDVAAYSAGTTYSANAIVYSGTVDTVYRALLGSNTGNTPASSPTYWKLLPTWDTTPPFLPAQTWLSSSTYAVGRWVSFNSKNYVAVQSTTNNNPGSSPTYWQEYSYDKFPKGLVLDRNIIESTAYTNNTVHLFKPDCASMIMVGNYVHNEGGFAGLECKAVSSDTARGRWLVYRNYIAAPAINWLIGGTAVIPEDNNCSDVTVRENWFYKDPKWFRRATAGSHGGNYYDGNDRTVKNNFELKKGVRWLIEKNLFENHPYGDTSQPYPVVFKLTGVYTGQQQMQTKDITCRYNVLKNVNGAFALGGQDIYSGLGSDAPPSDISVYHNFTQGRLGNWETAGGGYQCHMMALGNASPRITVVHNTIIGPTSRLTFNGGDLGDGTSMVATDTFNNNLWCFSTYGITSDSSVYIGKEGFGSGCYGNVMEDPSSSSAAYYGTLGTRSGYTDSTRFTFYTDIASMCESFDAGDERTKSTLANSGYQGRTPGADVVTVKSYTAHCADGAWV